MIEKGTRNGTITIDDGSFEIEVNNPNSTLVFTFIGMVTQELPLNGQNEVLVKTKWDCYKDFFDSQQVSIYANSGVINNPLGGQINMASPYFLGGVIKGSYGYQTNLDENKHQKAKIELSHYISNCDFDIDFRWDYRKVLFENDLRSITNSFEADLNVGNLKLIAGYTHLDFNKIETANNETSSGVLIGFGTTFGLPLYPSIIGKISFYQQKIEYQIDIEGGYKRLLFLLKYYKLDSFNELSIGVGTWFGYRLRRQKE